MHVVDSRELLPAFVICTDRPHTPPWSLSFEHQYGGHSCLHRPLLGCVLRLAANLEIDKNWLLWRALSELGESWTGREAPEAAELREQFASLVHHPSHGLELTPPDIADLTRLFAFLLGSRELSPPVVESGYEALLEFAAFPTIPFFEGWRITTACECGQLHDSARYDKAVAEELGATRVLLIWENSD